VCHWRRLWCFPAVGGCRRHTRHEDQLTRDRAAAIYGALRAANPDPRSELEFSTPFELLVAVILSAQATDRSVNIGTKLLFPKANTPAAILELGVTGLTPCIRHIGLYNAKAKNVIAMCRLLIERHGSEVPRDRDALEALPGVGRKTANVVLNVAFGEPTLAVDTHVFRVANRTGLARGSTPLAVERRLLKVTPAQFLPHAHHWLILHGRHVCVARKPRCPDCCISTWCAYKPKTKAGAKAP
jgi:endonuclease III